MKEPRISLPRLLNRLDALSGLGRDLSGGFTRLPFSPPHLEALRVAARMMTEAGLETGVDEFGNIVGQVPGANSSGALLTGSHLDTVPNGGRFDGALGVATAIECAQALREAGILLHHDLAVVAFADEEGSGFGIGTLSSRLLTGEVSLSRAGSLRDAAGRSLRELLQARSHGLSEARVPGRVRAFLELHIEQGPLLDQLHRPVAVVDHVTGIASTTFTFRGRARHAGTTPMDAHADALLGAAMFIVSINEMACATDGGAVATVGRITVSPGARNVIPGTATMSVEVRSPREEEQERLRRAVNGRARRIAADLGLGVTIEEWDRSPPQPLDPGLREIALASLVARGHEPTVLSSWAGHDAAVLARYVPAGMLFVQSRHGISHSPEEDTPEDAIEVGAQVMLDTLLALDRSNDPGRVLPLAYGSRDWRS